MRDTIAAAMRNPAVAKVPEDQGAEPGGDAPEAFGAFLRSKISCWDAVVRSANVEPD